MKFRFSTSRTPWVIQSESGQFIHFFISNSISDSEAFRSAFLSLFSKSSYKYAPTQLNMTPCERSPARLQFQQKTLTVEFPHEKNRWEQTAEAFGGERKFNLQSLSPPASPYLATLLATNLLVSIRLIDKRQVLLYSNYDPVQLLVHIRKIICSFLEFKKLNRAQNQSYLLWSGWYDGLVAVERRL